MFFTIISSFLIHTFTIFFNFPLYRISRFSLEQAIFNREGPNRQKAINIRGLSRLSRVTKNIKLIFLFFF